MSRNSHPAVRALIALLLCLLPVAGSAAAEMEPLLRGLAARSFDEKASAIAALVGSGDERVSAVLQEMAEGRLYVRKADGTVFIVTDAGDVIDPATGDFAADVAPDELDKITVNNRLRRTIRDAVASLTLASPDPEARSAAADAAFRNPVPNGIPAIEAALAVEGDAAIRAKLDEARAAAILKDDRPETELLDAVAVVAGRGDREALALLAGLAAGPASPVAEAAAEALTSVEQVQMVWAAVQTIIYGLSLGSVLLLAAIGLAITFGVMGVINMAHGEMVMLGAYTTFVVQEAVRQSAPGLFDVSILLAIPLAFAVSGLVGMAIERGVIRHLYGRPLETLLATWGVSLILQQAIRSIFGPTNREVGNPSWMSGAVEIGWITVTYNRLAIIVFALLVFGLIGLVLKRTRLGLHMRAVTQNRRMAASVGIDTRRVDALTFGLGSGVAGMAGVALSQIDNVSPNLGQSYIIDSFMVVVFGGVGNLVGTLFGAMTLGIANKLLEPVAGAVLAKIAVLVFIILFIQRRPRGLFALRGRAVDA